MQKRRPVMLAILDGWGWREDAADNAVRQARTPSFDRLWESGPQWSRSIGTGGRDPSERLITIAGMRTKRSGRAAGPCPLGLR